MKGMAMIKAKDLVLLSVAGKLPTPEDDMEDGQPTVEKLRIFAASTSVDHPKVPPTPQYNRMTLSISGFFIEEVGSKGSKIVQITDLSGLGCTSAPFCSRMLSTLTGRLCCSLDPQQRPSHDHADDASQIARQARRGRGKRHRLHERVPASDARQEGAGNRKR